MANDCAPARHITTITVIDPESGGSVDLSVYKHDNGGLFAIDASYLVYGSPRLVAGDDADPLIPDPFDDEGRALVRLADGFVSDPGDGETGPTTGRGVSVEPPVALRSGGREAPTGEEVRGRVYTYPCAPDDWRSFVRAMRSGDPVEMDSGMWEYWLNVLPPVYMDWTIDGHNYSFGAAEGREAIVDFWREGGAAVLSALRAHQRPRVAARTTRTGHKERRGALGGSGCARAPPRRVPTVSPDEVAGEREERRCMT